MTYSTTVWNTEDSTQLSWCTPECTQSSELCQWVGYLSFLHQENTEYTVQFHMDKYMNVEMTCYRCDQWNNMIIPSIHSFKWAEQVSLGWNPDYICVLSTLLESYFHVALSYRDWSPANSTRPRQETGLLYCPRAQLVKRVTIWSAPHSLNFTMKKDRLLSVKMKCNNSVVVETVQQEKYVFHIHIILWRPKLPIHRVGSSTTHEKKQKQGTDVVWTTFKDLSQNCHHSTPPNDSGTSIRRSAVCTTLHGWHIRKYLAANCCQLTLIMTTMIGISPVILRSWAA